MKRFGAVIIVSILAVLPACGTDPVDLPPGSLSLGWIVGTGGCEAAGIRTVIVGLKASGEEGTSLYSYECGDGEITIGGLTPASYDVTLQGRSADGRDRYGAVLRDVEVRSEGNTRVGTVRLSALPAKITASWYFENSRMCSYNSVIEVTISLFDQQDYEQYNQVESCLVGEAALLGVDADRYLVNIDGRDSEGDILFNGQEEVVVDRGDEIRVEVCLSPVVSGN
ncbi:MAG: hypothetical protein JW797_06305 [Bradymonadales bacterium]|nr:hypothetical protein [Bradymonadales bacterium]